MNEISFGQLMSVISTEERWVYHGSLTTPPCSTVVHWNVVSRVYPIKKSHLELFRRRLRGHGGASGLEINGNYRIVQKIDKHDVKLIRQAEKSK